MINFNNFIIDYNDYKTPLPTGTILALKSVEPFSNPNSGNSQRGTVKIYDKNNALVDTFYFGNDGIVNGSVNIQSGANKIIYTKKTKIPTLNMKHLRDIADKFIDYEEPFESAKIKLAIELIQRAILANHRILLFTQFSSVFPIIEKLLDELNIKHFTLDGKTKALNRKEMVDDMQKLYD